MLAVQIKDETDNVVTEALYEERERESEMLFNVEAERYYFD